MISKGWVQAVLIVILAGFAGLLYLAYATYKVEPPIPKRALSPSGHVLFTGADVTSGQEAFLTYGLMEYGSVYGHGAYLGPDFTADYLHRQALEMQEVYGGGRRSRRQRVQQELQANRYDPQTETLLHLDRRAGPGLRDAHAATTRAESSTAAAAARAWGRARFPTRAEIRQITAFFAWTAWTASARRPGQTYSTRTTGRPNRWSATS